MNLYKWMAEKGMGEILEGQTLLRNRKDKKLWRLMITHVLNAILNLYVTLSIAFYNATWIIILPDLFNYDVPSK